MKDVVRVQGTSGTTGKLTIAPYSQKDVDVWGECVARGLTMAGLSNEDIIHVCYGYGLFTGGMGLDFGAKALGATAIPMSAGNTKRQMMVMEDLGANSICVYAFVCSVPCGIDPGGRSCRPYEAESGDPRCRAVDRGDAQEDREHPAYQLF